MENQQHTISVIVATYNWPAALDLCLQSLLVQSDSNFDIVIADDGSTATTADLIRNYQNKSPIKIVHLWHEDQGFRKSQILNKAIEKAEGEYLIFIDGDCLAQTDFIARHRQLAQTEMMVTGGRILSSQSLANSLLSTGDIKKLNLVSSGMRLGLTKKLNKWLCLYLKLPNHPLRRYSQFIWRRIKGCNMACWKSDAQKILGFDENMSGWGHEDADFVFRLSQAGVRRKSGSWATEVIHLWHPQSQHAGADTNAEIVSEKIWQATGKKMYPH